MKTIWFIFVNFLVFTFAQENFGAEKIQLSDYFPMRVGTTLSYTIEMGYVEPISYEEFVWPGSTSSNRRDFEAIGTNEPKKIFLLDLKIKDPEKNYEQMKNLHGVEDVVEKDELGIYKNAKQVFWAINPDNSMCLEIAVCPPKKSIAPDDVDKDGISEKALLFQVKSDKKINRNKNFKGSHDTLLFAGIKNIPGSDIPALHFIRNVKVGFPDSEKAETFTLSIHKAFEEHSYFVKGKGLVYLEQIIGGNTSMIWKLQDQKK